PEHAEGETDQKTVNGEGRPDDFGHREGGQMVARVGRMGRKGWRGRRGWRGREGRMGRTPPALPARPARPRYWAIGPEYPTGPPSVCAHRYGLATDSPKSPPNISVNPTSHTFAGK